MSSSERAVDTVIFDLGGVLAETGKPSDFAKRFPHADHELVLRILMGDYAIDSDHPWHRLERGEITLAESRDLNRAAFAEAGIDLSAPTPPTSGGISSALAFRPNQPVVSLVEELHAAGIRLGVLTNNVREFREHWWTMLPFEEWFDDVVDSHEVGLRKPNPAIYELALSRLGADAARTAFLDDVASNVTAAESVGMVGVLVDDDPWPAVHRVRDLAGLV